MNDENIAIFNDLLLQSESVSKLIHTHGCIDAVADWVNMYIYVISGVCLALILIPVRIPYLVINSSSVLQIVLNRVGLMIIL